jgi:hypothetical protein
MNVKLGETRKEWLWLVIRFAMVILMKEQGKPQKYLSVKLASGFDIRKFWLKIAGFRIELMCIIWDSKWME